MINLLHGNGLFCLPFCFAKQGAHQQQKSISLIYDEDNVFFFSSPNAMNAIVVF